MRNTRSISQMRMMPKTPGSPKMQMGYPSPVRNVNNQMPAPLMASFNRLGRVKKAAKKRKSGNWIKGAIKHPGALRKQLGAKAGKPIPAKKLRAAAKKGGKEGKRARLAMTLKKLNK